MRNHSEKKANSYWLLLASCYGLTIGFATISVMPWLLLWGGIFIVFPVVIAWIYGQIGRKVRYGLVPDKPAITITATSFAVLATVLHGSPITAWAGPLLGLATFIGTYLCLRRFGHFYQSADEAPTPAQ